MKRSQPTSVLSPEVIGFLRGRGREEPYAQGSVIVRRGEPGRAFWVVLEGTVEVRLTGEEGVQLPLARFGERAFFGEMSLLTGDPVSADVVALTPVTLLRCAGEDFPALLGESGPLRTQVMAGLAQNLRGTSTDVWNFFQQAKALNVMRDGRAAAGPIVAESAAMRQVAETVARLAGAGDPVLCTGDPGTGKRFLAAKLHEAWAPADSPFVAVDCRALAPAEAMKFLFGSGGFLRDGAAPSGNLALRQYGALQLAHRGTLVLRHVERLPLTAQDVLARYLALRREGEVEYPSTRVVATTDLRPEAFAAPAATAPALARELAGAQIRVPRLVDRRRDVLPLARLFLEQAGAAGPRLERSAEHALVSLRYTHRNAAELREAVQMAFLFADEGGIRAEHIFSGPKDEGSVHEIDLSQVRLARRLTSARALAAGRGAVLALFAAVVAGSLLGGDSAAGRTANALTWGLWEPALFAVFLVLGRVWCTVCPLSSAARAAARLGSLGRPPGAWLKRSSAWLVVAGFLLIIWAERAFSMTTRPRAAGWLLLTLLGAAVLFAVLYRREAWCRYVCPLGNLGAALSLPAVLNVRANASVCSTLCTTHECFKGSATHPGCPVFHHPLYASDSQACKQCYQCLRVCPHGSARLRLRLPLQSVWAQADVGDALAPFALFFLFFSPAMLASQGASWAASVPGFTATALLAVAAAALARPWLPRLLSAGPEPDPALAARVAFGLMVLGWGPAMAYQLRHLPGIGGLHLRAEPGTFLAGQLPAGGLSLLVLSQAGVVLLAAGAAAVCLFGILVRARRERQDLSKRGWNLLLALGACYVLGALALIR